MTNTNCLCVENMSSELPPTPSERVTMELLAETEPAISNALNGLGHQPIVERGQWADFKARSVGQFGAENLDDDTPLSAYDAAKAIGIEHYYDTHYRGFGHYTHGLLEAISGSLNELIDPEASRVIL